MEETYNQLIREEINEYLEDNLDSSVYNTTSLNEIVLKDYIENFGFDYLIEDIQENIDKILYTEFKIEI